MSTIKELRAKSADIAMKARELFGDESKTVECERMLADHDAIEARIAVAQRLEAAETHLNAVDETRRPQETRAKSNSDENKARYEAAAMASLRSRYEADVSVENRATLDAGYETRDGQVIGTASAGGLLVPTLIADQIVVAQKYYNAMNASNFTYFDTTTGAPINIVQRDSTGARAKNTGEAATSIANVVTYTDVSVSAYKVQSDIYKASWELIQDASFDIAADLAEHMGESMGRQINDLLTFGTGSGQPTGILTAINTPSLSSQSNASTGSSALSPNDFLNLEAAVDPAYRQNPKTAFMFADSVRLAARQMVDATGRYYWQPALTAGDQPTLFGYNYIINPSMSSKATGTTFACFGDFSKFRVRNVKGLFLTRFNELYAASGQTGWMMTQRLDSVLVDKRAVAGIRGS